MGAAARVLNLPSDLSNRDYALLWYLGLQRHVLGDAGLKALHPLYRGNPAYMTNLDYVRQMHYAAMSRIAHALNGDLLRQMVRAVDSYVRDTLAVPKLRETAAAAPYVAELDRSGHVTLPPIDATRVREMADWFAGQPVRPGLYDAEGPLCPLSEVGEANIANYPAATVLACPHLAAIASDPLIVETVARHLGARPIIVGYTAWWSFAGRAEARDAQLFHLDNADYAFCKLFVQLTDVDMVAYDLQTGSYVARLESDPAVAEQHRASATAFARLFDDLGVVSLLDDGTGEATMLASILGQMRQPPAGGDPIEAADIALAFAEIGAHRLVATRLDMARRLSSLLAAAAGARMGFSEFSVTHQVADGLSAVDPVAFARLLLPERRIPDRRPTVRASHASEAAL